MYYKEWWVYVASVVEYVKTQKMQQEDAGEHAPIKCADIQNEVTSTVKSQVPDHVKAALLENIKVIVSKKICGEKIRNGGDEQ